MFSSFFYSRLLRLTTVTRNVPTKQTKSRYRNLVDVNLGASHSSKMWLRSKGVKVINWVNYQVFLTWVLCYTTIYGHQFPITNILWILYENVFEIKRRSTSWANKNANMRPSRKIYLYKGQVLWLQVSLLETEKNYIPPDMWIDQPTSWIFNCP